MDKARLQTIYRKTDGSCHLCGRKCTFSEYGNHQSKGGWHVEHSKAKAYGGTDHLNNLYAAHTNCNLSKATKSTRSERTKYGLTRAPLSKAKKEESRRNNIAGSIALGAGALFLLLVANSNNNQNPPKHSAWN